MGWLNKHFSSVIPRVKREMSSRRRNYSVQKSEFHERTVPIMTCGQLYSDWKKAKLYRKVPPGDLKFDVKFIDTRPDEGTGTTDVPTVLALHGAPGSWRDYTMLSAFLHERGCRVIAPTFPDFNNYKPGVFRHSDSEKAQYIKDFLAAIAVKDIDLLICHSGSVYPGLNLCLGEEPRIKSLALINSVTYDISAMNITKHFFVYKTLLWSIQNPITIKIVQTLGPFVMKNIMKVPVRVENPLDPLLSAATLVYGSIPESRDKFMRIREKIPILYIFSENDILIGSHASYNLAELFGAKVSNVFVYDKEGKLVQEGVETPALKVLAFQEGSHYAFLKHADIVNKEIALFLESRIKKSC